MKYKSGEDFLNHLYKNMHMSEAVMHTAQKSDTPVEKISKYMDRLENTHEVASSSAHKMEVLKQFYYNKYVIKTVPENYIVLQKRIAKKEGHGDIEITERLKQEMLTTIQKDQKSSLDTWLDYLSSEDAMYPMWFKYYAFTEMLKLGKFDKETGTFGKRTSTTADTFIELNPEVLAQVYNILSKEIKTETPTENEEQALIQGESFKKLYTFYFRETGIMEENKEIEGKWIKYEQGDNYIPLWESLQGKNTGWCTAGEATAKIQLQNGDFYVYYTKDENNEYTNPRIAIRMNGRNEIGEVRGISKKQNLESNMIDIANNKLNEFPDADKYRKRVSDMNRLTEIEKKSRENIELTVDDLKFLYEVESKIEGFGYRKDPRIEEIKEHRNMKKDYSTIFCCKEEQIASSLDEFDPKNTVVFVGHLLINEERVNFPKLKMITGYANFNSLTSAEGLNSLQSIGVDANFAVLTSAEGLNNLRWIGNKFHFYSLENADALKRCNKYEEIKKQVDMRIMLSGGKGKDTTINSFPNQKL